MEFSLSRLFTYSVVLINLTYVAVFVGMVRTLPEFVKPLNLAVQTALCLVLLYRYHPFRASFRLRDADAQLIFGGASLLFTNIVLVQLENQWDRIAPVLGLPSTRSLPRPGGL